MITTITGKNQVTVPARLVSLAHLHPGSRLDWELSETGDALIVRVLPDTATVAAQLRGCGCKHRKRGGSAVRNLVNERVQEDQERD